MSGLTRRTECCPNVLRRPCSKLRRHRRIRIPWVRTCERDKPYRRARSRECWRWSSPTSCCTGLEINKGGKMINDTCIKSTIDCYPNVILHPNTASIFHQHLPPSTSSSIFHPASFSPFFFLKANQSWLDHFTAFEALLVPFHATGYALFGGVHGLGALGALGDIDGDERHLETLKDLHQIETKN